MFETESYLSTEEIKEDHYVFKSEYKIENLKDVNKIWSKETSLFLPKCDWEENEYIKLNVDSLKVNIDDAELNCNRLDTKQSKTKEENLGIQTPMKKPLMKYKIKHDQDELKKILTTNNNFKFDSYSKNEIDDTPIPNKDINTYECDHCQSIFCRRDYLVSHLKLHVNVRDYKCAHCSYSSSRKATLTRHLQTHSHSLFKFKCSICESDFTRKSNLLRHLRQHDGEYSNSKQKFKCTYCSLSFSAKYILKNHISRHTLERPFQCEYCNFTTARSYSLKLHVLKHTHDYKFQCTVCSKKYLKKENLEQHIITHSDSSSPSCKTQSLKCLICNKKFVYKSRLESHMWTHTGERPFKCSICGSGFVQRSEMRKHVLTHMKEHFQCSQCDYSSFNRNDIGRHKHIAHPDQNQSHQQSFQSDVKNWKYTKVHLGRNILQCAHCDFSSKSRTKLINHLKTHRK